MRQFLSLSVILVLLASCSISSEIRHVQVKNKFSLYIPTFLSPTNELNDVASLQYANGEKELYIIVIDEDKASIVQVSEDNELNDIYQPTLDGFTQLMLDNYCESVDIDRISDVSNISFNGLDARWVTIEGAVDGVSVFLEIAYIEGNSSYYQLMTWTLLEKKEEFSEQMKVMINSFSEL